MSEQQDAPVQADSAPAEDAPQSDWKPPASQADLDRIISDRLARERAKYGDIDALREKAQFWDQIEEASRTELERAQQETTRWQNEATTWRTNAVSSRVETLAAADFADPSDALAGVSDPAKYLDAGGQINEDAIKADLAALLERKPHWRKADASPTGPRVPAPNPAQGSGVNGTASANPRDQFGALIQGLMNKA